MESPPATNAALIDSLLRVIAASFGDLPHSVNLFQSGEDLRGRQLASGTPLLAEVLAGVMMQIPGTFARQWAA